jgi:hypothetical protein
MRTVSAMITMAAFAIVGAALGMFLRPRLLGVLVPVMLAATVEGGVFWMIGVMEKQPTGPRASALALRQAQGEDYF